MMVSYEKGSLYCIGYSSKGILKKCLAFTIPQFRLISYCLSFGRIIKNMTPNI